MTRIPSRLVAVALTLFVLACGGASDAPDQGGAGRGGATGGAGGSPFGGTAGGTASAGGAGGAAGSSRAGEGQGGSAGDRGGQAGGDVGGSAGKGTGGATAGTGGIPATGGGGSPATGGALATGGSPATGGAVGTTGGAAGGTAGGGGNPGVIVIPPIPLDFTVTACSPAALTSNSLTVVGTADNHGVILRLGATTGLLEPFKGYDSFPPLRGLSSNCVVGDGGTIVEGNTDFLAANSGVPTTARLLGSFVGADPTQLPRFGVPVNKNIVVGEGGTILQHSIGIDRWATVTSPTTKTLRSIAGGNDTRDVWAVGDDGEIIHYNGSSWSGNWRAPTPGMSLRAVSKGWVVGDGGTAFELSQNGTVDHNTGTPLNLNAVAVYPGTVSPPFAPPVIAAGDGGIVLNWNGVKWQPLPSPTMAPLYAACFTSSVYNTYKLVVGGADGAYSIPWPSTGATWTKLDVDMGNFSTSPRALETANGDIWAAYATNEAPALSRIVRIRQGVITTVSMFALDPVLRFVEVPGGSVWATTKSGYFRWDGQTFVQQSTDPGAVVGGTANDALWFTNGRPGADRPASFRAIDDVWSLPLAHWNGSTWTTPVLPMPSVNPGTLLQVRVAPDGVWILGEQAVLKWNGTDLVVLAKLSDNGFGGRLFQDFWPLSDRDIWLSDGSSLIYHWNGQGFTALAGDGSTFTGGSDHAWRIGPNKLVRLPQ